MKYGILSKYRTEFMGIAMLMVMLFHAYDIDFGFDILNYIRKYLFIGVDIFVFLSGLGISFSLSKREQNYSDYMRSRAARILPSYFVVMIPYTLFCIFWDKAPFSALIWNSTLLSYWVKPKGAFNWYITGIMLLYAIAPFWHKNILGRRHRVALTFGGIALTGICTYALMRDGYWFHLDIIYRVPVFVIGMLLGRYIFEDKKIGVGGFLASWVSFAFGICLFWIGRNISSYIPPCYAFTYLVFPFLLLISIIFEYLPLGYLRHGLRFLGESSLEIYLLNVSLFAETTLLRSVVSFGPTDRLYYLITIALNTVGGIALHFLINKLKELGRKR